jgi:predicted Zn-dependent peptidase
MNNYKINKLKNGLKIIKINIPNYKTCSIVASIKVGSKYESLKENGAAHFLEHVNFRGTTKIKNANAITYELDSMGCSFNAYTTKQITVYHFKTAYDIKYIDKILFILSQILFESKHKLSDIESERKIILEELKKTLDNPDESIDDHICEMIFKNSPLALTTLGKRKTIKGIEQKTIHKFYQKYYVPNNMVISIAGKVPSDIDNMVKKYFAKYSMANNLDRIIIPYAFENKKPELKVITNLKKNQCYINIAFPALSIHDPKLYSLYLLSLYLGGNMSSYLFVELREKKSLVYDISSDVFAYEEGGYLSIYTSTDSKNVNKTISIILTKLAEVYKFNFDNLDVLKINTLHSKEMEWEDSYNIAEYYSEELLLRKKIKSTHEHLKCYQNVKKKDIIELAKNILNFNKMKVVIMGNIKSSDINLSKIMKVVS